MNIPRKRDVLFCPWNDKKGSGKSGRFFPYRRLFRTEGSERAKRWRVGIEVID